ncbi:MAG: ferritin [Candidatus Omnitrophota bacterium]
MLSKKMIDSLNDQINKEIYSAYLYLGMASYASSIGLNGVANWFNIQVKEELSHADKFYNYVAQQGARVALDEIEKPPQSFKSAQDLFDKTLEHEKMVTKRINDLVDCARKEKDHATGAFLQWFVTEQVEEEANASEILQKLKLIGKDGNGLLVIDSQLAARVFVPPATGKSA